MPLFAGMIASSLAWFITFFGLQISTRLAIILGVVAVSSAAYLAVKAAIFAIVTGLSFVVAPSIMAVVAYVLPSNLPTCIAVIFLSDAIYEAWGFWQGKLNTVALGLLRV